MFEHWFFYPETLLNFLNSNGIFGFLWFSNTRSCYLWIEIVFCLTFQSECFYLFYLLNSSGKIFQYSVAYKCWISFLFLILRGKHSDFHYWWELCVLMPFIRVRTLCECFYDERVLDFAKCSFCVYWDDHVGFVLSFILLIWCITIISFLILNQTCILEINPIWL